MAKTRILNLIPEDIKDELIQEVKDLLEEEKQKGPTADDVKKDIEAWVEARKKNLKK